MTDPPPGAREWFSRLGPPSSHRLHEQYDENDSNEHQAADRGTDDDAGLKAFTLAVGWTIVVVHDALLSVTYLVVIATCGVLEFHRPPGKIHNGDAA